MKPGLIIIGIVILIGIIFFISKSSGNKISLVQVAKQIKLDQLESVLEQLKNKKLEYDFFGITSNGIDCIYFVNKNDKINIEFEVMTNDQKPYVSKLKQFASENKYHFSETTYGNQPNFDDVKNAPVYIIETNADVETATEIGKKIMTSIFNANATTNFDVVP